MASAAAAAAAGEMTCQRSEAGGGDGSWALTRVAGGLRPQHSHTTPSDSDPGTNSASDQETKRQGELSSISAASASPQSRCSKSFASMAALERFVATVVFCEAPFDGTLAPPVPTGDGASTSDPKKHGGGAAMKVSSLVAAAKEAAKHSFSSQPKQQQQQTAATVDGLAIFETIAMQ